MRGFYEPAHYLRSSADSVDSMGVLKTQNQSKPLKLWRSTSLTNLVSSSKKNKSPVYESAPLTDSFKEWTSSERLNRLSGYKNNKQFWKLKELENFWNSWDTIVNIVLIAAKDLPPAPNDGAFHELYCKFRLGSETFKSKSIPHSRSPEWRQRLKLHMYKENMLELTVWDKGRQKFFMGSCILDLSILEKERTHDFWHELDEGYGFIHLSLTMCVVRYVPTLHIDSNIEHKHSFLDEKSDSKLVGSFHVKLIKAKGLSGKPSAYCTLELDNEKLQSYTARSSLEPTWNKSYAFNVYDVTSVFKLKVYGTVLTDTLLSEFLGQVSIPLLNIKNGETRWYVLKCRNNRTIARGNCPRILLQMTIVWNPIKATLRLFRPKEAKHIEKSYAWDIPLIFRNVVIFANVYNSLVHLNENFKSLFEWHSREISGLALLAWLIFCYYLTPWSIPLILLLTFIFSWIYSNGRIVLNISDVRVDNEAEVKSIKDNKGLPNKINDMHEVLTTVAYVLELVVSLIERLTNLFTFKVPFLSYVFMMILGFLTVVLYFVPFNYLLMLFGFYKFMRKYLNPDRILNNDVLDFISRIPDNRVLKDWKELNVPEPMP